MTSVESPSLKISSPERTWRVSVALLKMPVRVHSVSATVQLRRRLLARGRAFRIDEGGGDLPRRYFAPACT